MPTVGFGGAAGDGMVSWVEVAEGLAALARVQLFFCGGAPRSGTTWLQQILDSHPAVSCGGEGLFQRALAGPIEALVAARAQALAAKNATVFKEGGGYGLPDGGDAAFLLGSGILLALQRQAGGKACAAIGEKTPENVFFFPQLKEIFPQAKFIGIVRDPRDVLTSAWHFFQGARVHADEAAAKLAFVQGAVGSIEAGARLMVAHEQNFAGDVVIVRYEDLLTDMAAVAGGLFRFLGVDDSENLVRDGVARTGFAQASGGRAPGVEVRGAFLRKGVAGDWRGTLSPAMIAVIEARMGWMFERFGWEI